MATVATETKAGYVGNDRLLLGMILGVLAFWLFAQTTRTWPPIRCPRFRSGRGRCSGGSSARTGREAAGTKTRGDQGTPRGKENAVASQGLFTGKAAIITGAGSGIGEACAAVTAVQAERWSSPLSDARTLARVPV